MDFFKILGILECDVEIFECTYTKETMFNLTTTFFIAPDNQSIINLLIFNAFLPLKGYQ